MNRNNKKIIKEASEGDILNYPGDSIYEYKFESGKWFGRKLGTPSWRDLSRYQSTVGNLNSEFPEFTQVSQAQVYADVSQTSAQPTSAQFPFETWIRSSEDGNRFRSWVNLNKTAQEQSDLFSGLRDNKLDVSSSQYNNAYMKRAYNAWGTEWLADIGVVGRQAVAGHRDLKRSGRRFRVHPEFSESGKISTFEKAALERGEEVNFLHICTTTQCAQYVSDTLNQPDMVRGNAWHRHRPGDVAYSAFSNISDAQVSEIEELFNDMNSNGPSTSYNSEVRRLVRDFVPDQGQFLSLDIGDIVGLYHHDSDNHAKAFFEGGTGRKDWGSGVDVRGSGFSGWSPQAIGTDQYFSLGPNTRRTGFGMNSHVGFVGAINSSGEPIIFHNVGGNVKATPIGRMNRRGDAIVWVDPAPGAIAAITPEEVDILSLDPADVESTALAERLRRGIKEERLKKKLR
tara:strand:- start:92 stop:1456 length:1365 start_codon:yes stop_codon:yes gene_type:complete